MNTTTAPAARSLRLWMKSAGMSQDSLASALECSRQAVSTWLTGAARPDSLRRHQIAAMSAGGVAVTDWLLPDEVAKVEGARS